MATRRLIVVCALAGSSMAQQNAPIGVLRGSLVSWAGTPRAGQLTFRGSESRLFVCSYDDKTWFERQNQRISVGGAEAGDRLEVVSDRHPGSDVCYARTVHILDTPLPLVPGARRQLRTYQGASEVFAPRGDLTFAGIVVSIDSAGLVLRTRSGELRTIALRPDTRYLTEGQAAARDHLVPQTRVFIRAGRNLENQIEAYQVVWGEILRP